MTGSTGAPRTSSSLTLHVSPALEAHPLRAMLAAGLCVTINSDDPAYFGGYISENLLQCQRSLGLSMEDIATLARNSFSAAFIPAAEAAQGISSVTAYCKPFRRIPEHNLDQPSVGCLPKGSPSAYP